MALEIYWGSGSPVAWAVLLCLEYKELPYVSHLLQFSKKEHKAPEILKMNPRGRVPVLKDGDFSLYESQAIMQYLERKYPQKPLFGKTPEESGKIQQVISEFVSYLHKPMGDMTRPFFLNQKEIDFERVRKNAETVHQELREFNERLKRTPYLAGQSVTAADFTLYPHCKLFIRIGAKDELKRLELGFLPFEEKFPAIAQWMGRIESLPGYDKTYPPHWKQ